MNDPSKVRVRFPPSPTGYFHIGSARTALFNHLFAAHEAGAMVLRFEDTDKARSKREYEDDILEGLRWLGIPYELPAVFRQSERTAIYRGHIKRLLDAGRAYEAEAGTEAPDKKVVRFKNPGVDIAFHDLIRGEVSFNTKELGDFVIAKSADEPLYHLAVVIDDHDMGITHVIRGEDHISNTPRQILMLEALGFTRPRYAHIPLILAPDRSKLSKRHGAVSVNEYRKEGFLPQALVNYIALLGWNPGTDQELFSLDEMARLFSFDRVQKGGAVFDKEKLLWLNHQYLKRLPRDEYAALLRPFADSDTSTLPIELLQERARTLKEAADLLSAGEFDFAQSDISYDAALLISGAKTDAASAKAHLRRAGELLEPIAPQDFSAERVKEAVFPYATEQGRASVLWPLRVALSGRPKSPDPFVIAGFIGKEKTLARINEAAALLENV